MSNLKKDKIERGNYSTMPRHIKLGSTHNLVIVKEKNDSLWLCLDPRNRTSFAVCITLHLGKTENAQLFSSGHYLSSLSSKSGYWRKQVDRQSQQLLHCIQFIYKKCCVLHLPCGLLVSSEIVCEQMDHMSGFQITSRYKGHLKSIMNFPCWKLSKKLNKHTKV